MLVEYQGILGVIIGGIITGIISKYEVSKSTKNMEQQIRASLDQRIFQYKIESSLRNKEYLYRMKLEKYEKLSSPLVKYIRLNQSYILEVKNYYFKNNPNSYSIEELKNMEVSNNEKVRVEGKEINDIIKFLPEIRMFWVELSRENRKVMDKIFYNYLDNEADKDLDELKNIDINSLKIQGKFLQVIEDNIEKILKNMQNEISEVEIAWKKIKNDLGE